MIPIDRAWHPHWPKRPNQLTEAAPRLASRRSGLGARPRREGFSDLLNAIFGIHGRRDVAAQLHPAARSNGCDERLAKFSRERNTREDGVAASLARKP